MEYLIGALTVAAMMYLGVLAFMFVRWLGPRLEEGSLEELPTSRPRHRETTNPEEEPAPSRR